MKQVTLPDFLTEAQIAQLVALYESGGRAREICEQIIAPSMAEINRKLGQENDPMYLAYACEFVMSNARRSA